MAIWARLYAELLNDPKVQTLPLNSFKAFINALCLACQNGDPNGKIGTLGDVSFAFRETKECVSSAFHPLIEAGLIVTVDETFHVTKWKKRQYKSDTSTDRVKRFRERFRNVTDTVTVTAPEQSRADTEQSRAEQAQHDHFGESTKLPKIAPIEIVSAFDAAREKIWGSQNARFAPDARDKLIASRWIESGISIDFCRDFFMERMTRMREKEHQPPRCLAYFDEAIVQSFSTTRGKHKTQNKSIGSTDENMWKNRLELWKTKKKWNASWGPKPDEKGCRCPDDLAAQYEKQSA